MDQVRGLNPHRTLLLGDHFKAHFLAREDIKGHEYVGVKLEQQAPGGGSQEFKTDLDRLEAVLKRADELRRDPKGLGSAFRNERINDYEALFVPWPSRGQPETLAIRMDHKTEEGSQSFGINLDRLGSVVREGKEVEKELGYDQKQWHTLVYAGSVKEGEDGRVHAKVFKSVDSVQAAEKLIANNNGLALYSEPRRRPLEKGAEIDMDGEASVRVAGGRTRSVDAQVAHNELSAERLGEHYLVARWDDPNGPPLPGSRVSWEGTGQAYNGDFEDFKARPVGGRAQGEPDEAMYVLIRTDLSRPFNGTIEAFSKSRMEMTDALALNEQDRRAHTTDWLKQSFGMDRSQYGMDQTM